MIFSKLNGRIALSVSVASLYSFAGYGQISNKGLSEITEGLTNPDFGARYEARMSLQDEVSQASVPGNEAQKVAVEKQLLGLLEGDVLPVSGKLWVLRQLNTIGGRDSVDTLYALLSDAHTQIADAARMALGFNTSDESATALLKALDSKGNVDRVGIVDSIARKQKSDSLDSLVALLPDNDDAFTEAVILAISTFDKAERSLVALRGKLSMNANESLELALVKVSDDFGLLAELSTGGANDGVKTAAALKCLEISSAKASRMVKDLLVKGDSSVAAEMIRGAVASGKANSQKAVLALMDSMDNAEKGVLVSSLGSSKKSSKLEKIILEVAESDSEALKLQAATALGKMGSFASLDFLLDSAESRSRDLKEAAMRSLGSVKDSRIDKELLASAMKGDEDSRITAIAALGFRNSDGASSLLNEIAASDASKKVREAALESLESVGDSESFQTLIDLIIDGGMRRDAQSAIKRMSLRIGDPEAAWTAFEQGLMDAKENRAAYEALLAVIDSAPTNEALSYLRRSWKTGDEAMRKTILRVLTSWRNLEGGELLLEIAGMDSSGEDVVAECYKGIGRLLIASWGSASMEDKFDLGDASLKATNDAKNRHAVLNVFKRSGRREQGYARKMDLDPELMAVVMKE